MENDSSMIGNRIFSIKFERKKCIQTPFQSTNSHEFKWNAWIENSEVFESYFASDWHLNGFFFQQCSRVLVEFQTDEKISNALGG